MLLAGKIFIPDHELQWEFMQSSGPGGQNVNKVATAVRLTLELAGSTSIPDAFKARLLQKLGSSVTVTAREHRTQFLNRRAAEEKLSKLVEDALKERKKRRPTRPTKGSIVRRLDAKSRRGAIKRDRRISSDE